MIIELLVLAWVCIFAYQDYKTGYVNDTQAFVLIFLGFIYSLITDPFYIILAGFIAFIGFFFYYFGQMGGGDVQVFIILTLFFHRTLFFLPFVAWVFVISVILSSIIIPVNYLLKLGKIKEVFYVFVPSVVLLIFPVLSIFYLILVFQILLFKHKKEIMEKFVIEYKPVDKINYEDILALEHIENRKELGLWKRVLLPHELKSFKEKAKKLNIKKVPVYEHLPKFVPYIFFALLICYFLAVF